VLTRDYMDEEVWRRKKRCKKKNEEYEE